MAALLTAEEKAYCRALAALQSRDFETAEKELETCRGLFRDSHGFRIIEEATRLMVFLRRQKATLNTNN
jgi:hypothetical protein